MTAHKNHVKDSFTLDIPWTEDLDSWDAWLRHVRARVISADMKDATIHAVDTWGDYGGTDSIQVEGWIPMTEAQIEKAKSERLKARERRVKDAEAKERSEREQLRKLQAKYPDET